MATNTGLQMPELQLHAVTPGQTFQEIARETYDRVPIDLRQHAGHVVVPRPQHICADDENGEGYDCAHAWSPNWVRYPDTHLACLFEIVI